MKRNGAINSSLPVWLAGTSFNFKFCFPQLLPLIKPKAFDHFVASFFTLLIVIVLATIDPQIELKDKLLLQSSGLSHFLDTYSDAIAVAIIIFHMTKRNNWYSSPKALKMSYLGEILFGIVATHFHAVGVERRSGGDPHPFYCCYFCIVGAFILFWHARGLAFHISCKSLQKQLDMKIKASFTCLALMPLLLCSMGLSHVINRFVFNGYAFTYGSIVMDPILKRGMRDTKSTFIKMKLQITRFFFPMIFMAFVTEAIVAEKFHFDTHCLVHVLALAYVLLVHSCITTRGERES
jgi:hypothetical protein